MKRKLYIQLFSIHGLLRGDDFEMGRDADTGGQIKYVVELARKLSEQADVERVDLFTRLIADKAISEDYSRPIEELNSKCRIIRIQCGGRKYIRKELLWPYLDEYVDKTVKFIKKNNRIPDFVHGHYADGGYVAMQLSEFFGTPLVFTGHSLGRLKLRELLAQGANHADLNKRFKIDHRINIEEEVLKEADLVVTSTNNEVESQYDLYSNRKIPNFSVIPPGLDIDRFYPFYHDMLHESKKNEMEIYAHASVKQELNRFFIKQEKPIILALCRPEKQKNIAGLIEAYGEDEELQAIANLAIFAGIRKDIDEKEENERKVLTEMLLLMDKYDLYGKMAIPKKHNFEYEVPELYRITAESKGVFVNVALSENFGLTLIEASACGLPIMATKNGGPRDIIHNCKSGIMIDPQKTRQIRNTLKKMLTEQEQWEEYSKNGIMNVRKIYTWDAHVKTYMEKVNALPIVKNALLQPEKPDKNPVGKRLASLQYFLITDIDHTLIGENNEGLDELIGILKKYRNVLGFGVATGRDLESTTAVLEKYKFPAPDIIISSVGTEMYYGAKLLYDKGWDTHISYKWELKKYKDALSKLDYLELQEEKTQRKYKVSYFMDPAKDRISDLHSVLLRRKLRYSLIYSHDRYLDIVPYRASKGKAVRYLSYKWEIPLDNIIVCGDSGNDEEMLRGDTLGIIVANYSHELEKLRNTRNTYFAKQECAAGIVEGLKHYTILEKLEKCKHNPKG